jgi:hypothetical protein
MSSTAIASRCRAERKSGISSTASVRYHDPSRSSSTAGSPIRADISAA